MDETALTDCPMDHVYQVDADKAPAGSWHRPRFSDLQQAMDAYGVLPEDYGRRMTAYHAGMWSCIPCLAENRRTYGLLDSLGLNAEAGDHGTCANCGGEIEYYEETAPNGDVLNSWWSHLEHPADGHDAELGTREQR